jgi:hypothetical protein
MGRLESPSRGVAICFIVATTIPPSPSSPKKLSSADARSRPAGGKLPQVDAPAAPRPSVRASRRQPDPGRHGHSTATDCAEEQNDALIGPSREGRRKSGLQRTRRWRETDSNPRSPAKKNPLSETVLFDLSGNSLPRGTEGSNPSPSSAESAANLSGVRPRPPRRRAT